MPLKTDTDQAVDVKRIVQEPKLFVVVMHNDDITTMDFVVDVLIKIFHKAPVEATQIMMEIHVTGKSAVGTYTYDMAVTKKMRTEQLAFGQGFPLKMTIEEAE